MLKQILKIEEFRAVFLLSQCEDNTIAGDLYFNIKDKEGKFVLVDAGDLGKYITPLEPASGRKIWANLGSPFEPEVFDTWCCECFHAMYFGDQEKTTNHIKNNQHMFGSFAEFMLMFALYLKENGVEKEKWFVTMKPHISYDFEFVAKHCKFTEDN